MNQGIKNSNGEWGEVLKMLQEIKFIVVGLL